MKTLLTALALLFAAHALANEPAAPLRRTPSVSITVSDIDETIRFYERAVPYPLAKRYTLRASKFDRSLLGQRSREVEIAVIRTPTVDLELMDFAPGEASAPVSRPVIGPGYTHICFQSPASDSAYGKFRAAGLNMVSRGDAPIDIGGYGIVYAYGRDPDGIMIESETLSAPKRSEPAWVSHVANVVHDHELMLGFYEKLLGYGPRRKIEQANRKPLDDIANIDNLAIKGGWFGLEDFELEVWQYVRPQTPAPSRERKLDEIGYNSFALEVADLQAERERLRGLGVRLAGRVIELDGWQVQYAYDPEGNLFSVRQQLAPRDTE